MSVQRTIFILVVWFYKKLFVKPRQPQKIHRGLNNLNTKQILKTSSKLFHKIIQTSFGIEQPGDGQCRRGSAPISPGYEI
jgi:hypothetical protein